MQSSQYLSSPKSYARLLRQAMFISNAAASKDEIAAAVRPQVFQFKHAVALNNVFLEEVVEEVAVFIAQEPHLYCSVTQK